jgi:hypothetical protein
VDSLYLNFKPKRRNPARKTSTRRAATGSVAKPVRRTAGRTVRNTTRTIRRKRI